jgi:hypothetical protein
MTTMSRIALLTIALATATPAFAQPANPAYRDSGTHAGGPADELLSPTGGVPAPIRHTYSNPAYRYSGTHAGGPADDLLSPTGGRPAPIRHTYSNPAYRYSGTHAGGPADGLSGE